jgi:hypothetical protein
MLAGQAKIVTGKRSAMRAQQKGSAPTRAKPQKKKGAQQKRSNGIVAAPI